MFINKNNQKRKLQLLGNNNAGFSMVELIIAIAVLSFGVVLIYGSFYSIASVNYSLGPRFTAMNLAQEGIEIIRNLRDTNYINNVMWSTGIAGSPCSLGCRLDYKTVSYSQLAPYDDNVFLGLNSDGFYSYDIGATATIYRRKITVTPVAGDSNALNIESLVTWNYKGQLFSFKTDGNLYNWK